MTTARFDDLVAREMEKGTSRADAMARVMKAYPDVAAMAVTADAAVQQVRVDEARKSAAADASSSSSPSLREVVEKVIAQRVRDARTSKGLTVDAAYREVLADSTFKGLYWWSSQTEAHQPMAKALAALSARGMPAALVTKAFELA